jgi:hypothetical protein
VLFEQEDLDQFGPEPGLVQLFLHQTDDGHFVEYQNEYDPFRRDSSDHTYREVDRAYAFRKLAEIGAEPPPEGRPNDQPIECSQAELAEALGYQPGYTGLIRKLMADETLVYYERAGPHRWRVWFRDPVQHREVRDKIEQIRAERRAKRRKS